MYYSKPATYPIRCAICGSYEQLPVKRGPKSKICLNPDCVKEYKIKENQQARIIRDAKANESYKDANRRFMRLPYHQQRALMAALYEEIKRAPRSVDKSFRYAMTRSYVNTMKLKGTDKVVPTLAQTFYTFCVQERGCTPMQIFKQKKSDAEIKTIIDGEWNATPPRLIGNKWIPTHVPYDSTEFTSKNVYKGAIAYLLNETDKFEFSDIEKTVNLLREFDEPTNDDDTEECDQEQDDDEIILLEKIAPIVKRGLPNIVYGDFDWA